MSGNDTSWWPAVMGAKWSVISAFPIAGLMALVFRFPIPFAEYMSGFAAIIPAMLAVILYGVCLGGFVLVGTLGAVGGVLSARATAPTRRVQEQAVRITSLSITTLCLFVLATLDRIIGPW